MEKMVLKDTRKSIRYNFFIKDEQGKQRITGQSFYNINNISTEVISKLQDALNKVLVAQIVKAKESEDKNYITEFEANMHEAPEEEVVR